MKKITFIIFIILLSSLFFFNKKSKKVFNNNYEIIYKHGEVGITFILENNINALLINDNDNKNDIIILDYKTSNLEKQLKKFNIPTINNVYNITPVILKLFEKESKILTPHNDIIEFNYNNKSFCIYISNNSIEKNINCDIIYMYKFNKNDKINFGENVSIVFQNNNNKLKTSIQEKIYENWIDLYTITPYEYATLKILKDGFDTIIIPIIK